MRLAIQIFRKDAERLKWPVLLTLALLSYWTFQDATLPWDTDPRFLTTVPGSWLNLALPFAWFVLIALAIHQDSLVGDRPFWVTLPCGWKPLFAAKASFIAAFVHLPYFVSTVIVLMARGFNPAAHLPHLFWKQFVLLALTISALGAATLVRNVVHFVLLLVAIASAVVFRIKDFRVLDSQIWSWDIRWNLALIVLSAATVLIVTLQFARRCTRVSRTLGIVAAVAAASLYVWIPREATAAISAALSPAPESRNGVAVQLALQDPPYSPRWGYQMTVVAVPLVLDVPEGLEMRADQVNLEIIATDGAHYAVTPVKNVTPTFTDKSAAVLLSPAEPRGHLRETLFFYRPGLWGRVRSGRVTLHGRLIVEYGARGAELHLKSGETGSMDSLARCGVAALGDLPREYSAFSLECDSVELGGRNLSLGVGFLDENRYDPLSHFPESRWLSPVHRSQRAIGARSNLPLVVAPQMPRGFGVVDYTIPNIDLNQFEVRPR